LIKKKNTRPSPVAASKTVITAFKTQDVMVSPALSSFLRSRQVNE